MQLQNPFDARSVEPAGFAPPPPLADYHVRIVESEGKPTSNNRGGYLELTLEMLDPAFQGRKIPYRLNLYNENPQTVEIAYRQLSAVCHVTAQFNIQDTRQLHNIPFIATIGPQKDNPTYSNVFGVKDLSGNTPGKAGQPGQPIPATAPPVAAAPAPAWAPPVAAAPAAPQPWAPPAAQPWQPPVAAAPAAPTPAVWQAPTPAAPPQPAPAWAPAPGAPTPGAPGSKPPWER